MNVRDRVAIVTGGGSGIGRPTALRLAREEANVVVADVDEGAGHETVRLITATGGNAMFRHVDIRNEEDTAELVVFTDEVCG